MVEAEFLIKALEDLGYNWEQGDLQVGGFARSRARAEIRVKSGSPGYDIGFRKSGESYEIIADWWGIRNLRREQFQQQVAQRYAYHAARAKLESQGFILVEDTQEDGCLHLVLRRTT